MADHAIFLGWGEAIPGREHRALEVFNDLAGHLTQLRESKEIESWEAFALEPHGGDLVGFALIRGTAEQMAQLRRADEFRLLLAQGRLAVQGLGVVDAVTGQEMQRLFQMLERQVGAEV